MLVIEQMNVLSIVQVTLSFNGAFSTELKLVFSMVSYYEVVGKRFNVRSE